MYRRIFTPKIRSPSLTRELCFRQCAILFSVCNYFYIDNNNIPDEDENVFNNREIIAEEDEEEIPETYDVMPID